MSKKEFQNLFLDQLRDVYDAENQITKALPKMIETATSPDLKKALESHLEETFHQIERLDRIFSVLKEKPTGKKCAAMQGIIAEGKEILSSKEFSDLVKDAAIISAAQTVEHYEIARYGTLKTFAKEFGLDEIAELLDETLTEEGNADKKLTKIAEGGLFAAGINQKALKK